MKEVKYIEIILENCDEIRVNRENLGWFDMIGLNKEIHRITSNTIVETKSVSGILIHLLKNFEYEDICGNKQSAFKRIKDFHDITAIDVYFDDGSHDYYFVPYDDEEDDVLGTPNLNQKEVEKNGQLYIFISKDNTLKDFIDEETLNMDLSLEFS